ncbi:CopG family transcriptional regulator [Enterococcus faecium]|uniref:ribbon-helix-helix domain-containing protein n=1 Tax=Enterococcus TaxID=1350 RepID=UPI001F50B7A5|nr:CopG family transcriptional regulator [Enterococcus faecium]
MVSNDKKRVMLTLTKEVADDLEKKAKSMGLSKSALITSWINENRKEFEQKNKRFPRFLRETEIAILAFVLIR